MSTILAEWRKGLRRGQMDRGRSTLPVGYSEREGGLAGSPPGGRLAGAVCLVLLLWSVPPVLAAGPVTVEQVVARCAEALGGAGKLAAIKTLRFKVTYPGDQRVYTIDVRRPNRFRHEADFVLVFNGTRAGFLKGAPPKDGKDPGPQLVEAESWKDFEVDLAFTFPAFLDYPARYRGLETLDGREVHALVVALPLGTGMTYLLDATTFLPVKMVADVPFGGETYHPERVVGDYGETGGVLFPRSFTSTGWGPKGSATVVSLEVNIPFPNNSFEMPEGL
jgi:hypothetical protein